MLTFHDKEHAYIWEDGTRATSVTTLVHHYTPPFDWTPEQSSANKKKGNKWYGMDPKEIQAAWDGERDRSTALGTWYHNKRELELLQSEEVWVYSPIVRGGIKYAPEQKLTDGIYPEHLVYLKSANLAGQSDKVKVENGRVHINDYKTCKEIKRKGHTNWEGTKKMLSPVGHLDDCHINHYALQLSTYMYMILRHNPSLQPGDMTIEHVLFEEEGKDKYDYPIYRKDENGDYVVKEIILIPVPYLRKEVEAILNHHKNNK